MGRLVLLAVCLTARAALAAPLVVPVTLQRMPITHQTVRVSSNVYVVADTLGCSFDAFDFDPAANPEGIRFEATASGRFAQISASSALELTVSTAVSGTCIPTSLPSYDTANQRSGAAAVVDDGVDGDNVPAARLGSDGVTTTPYGYAGATSVSPSATPWVMRSMSVGIPAFGQPASRHDFCSCKVSVGGTYPFDPGSLISFVTYNMLADVVDAPPETCEHGGILVYRGLDDGVPSGTANDGQLQAGEREQTFSVCNGAPGEDGAAGATGPAGTNGQDGAPGDDGAQGANGHNGLVAVEDVAAGSECAAGGMRILSGVDDGADGGIADDGVLQGGEQRTVKILCAGVAGKDGESGKDGAGCSSLPTSWLAIFGAILVRRRRA
jgi:hypothetical protein